MNRLIILFLVGINCLLTACSPIKTPLTNQFKLGAFSNRQLASHPTRQSILVTTPAAVAGYQTDQMVYMKKPFELSYFANNGWINPPAEMLFPLILQSLQRSGYFYAVVSSPYTDKTDYRLDTQLIELQQNFIKKPSIIELVVKVALTRVSDDQVIASKIISQHVPCPIESPYGGVLAANRATESFTAELTRFVLAHVQHAKD